MPGPVAQPGGRFGLDIDVTSPVITGAVDGGDQDSAVISVTGGDTIRLFYRLLNAATWIEGETRFASGDIIQTGLTAGQWYEFYCKADTGSGLSDPSNLVTLLILASTATIEQAIYSLLSADPTVSGLVGNRITPVLVPQDSAMPAVTYAEVAGVRENTMDGPAGLVRSRWQFNCWGISYADGRSVSDAVRQVLDGYSGSGAGVTIQSIMTIGENNISANPAGKNVARRYGNSLDLEVWFCETA